MKVHSILAVEPTLKLLAAFKIGPPSVQSVIDFIKSPKKTGTALNGAKSGPSDALLWEENAPFRIVAPPCPSSMRAQLTL
jgi:hypothetical protein